MVLNSFKRKFDNISHDGRVQDVHVSEDNITFPPSKERYDIMACHYPLDNFSSELIFIITKMSDITLQHLG
jgi:hypothetical protein